MKVRELIAMFDESDMEKEVKVVKFSDQYDDPQDIIGVWIGTDEDDDGEEIQDDFVSIEIEQ